jgi:hypothetical protein
LDRLPELRAALAEEGGLTMHATCTPAYGRDYKTGNQARADWKAGKDFILNAWDSPWDGKPINREQALEAGFRVTLRFSKLTKTCRAEG